jgi:hypothetical protein
MSSPPVPYHVELTKVREVTLVGSADLAFWKDHLRPAGLHPARINGKAEVLIVACASRFFLVPFREVSFSVIVARAEDGPGRDGAFLLHAFNSVRFFAFCERAFFHTPYYPASIDVGVELPSRVRVVRGRDVWFQAGMGMTPAPPFRTGEEWWQGPIFLPARRAGEKDGDRLFFGKVGGPTRVYAHAPDCAVHFHPTPDHPALQFLLASSLDVKEWHVREAATHAKSRTVARSAVGW